MKYLTLKLWVIVFIVLFGNCATTPQRWTDYKIKIDDAEFTYEYSQDDVITIKGYQQLKEDTIVVIPSRIRNISVFKIKKESFRNKGITGVIIEDSIVVEENAFADNKITRVTFNGNNITIGKNAFNNNSIKEVVINTGGLTNIDPLEISGFGAAYILNGKKSGKYTLQEDGWYHNGNKLQLPEFAELLAGRNVIIVSINGNRPYLYLSEGLVSSVYSETIYILPQGRHIIEARYHNEKTNYNTIIKDDKTGKWVRGTSTTTTTSQVSTTLSQVFSKGKYIITGAEVYVLPNGKTIKEKDLLEFLGRVNDINDINDIKFQILFEISPLN